MFIPSHTSNGQLNFALLAVEVSVQKDFLIFKINSKTAPREFSYCVDNAQVLGLVRTFVVGVKLNHNA